MTPSRRRRAGILLTMGVAVASPASAHFILQSPASWREQNVLGDPQKTGPCGDEGTAAPTGAVTPFAPGETIVITIDEVIFHPGHYRVALSVNDRSELPPPPPVTPGATPCGSVPVMSPSEFPVLADGMLVHTDPFSGSQSFEVTLPSDVTCTRCTLQILEFMSDHAAPCFYHHCADVSIGSGTAGCTSDAECDDGDVCTIDRCGVDRTCRVTPLGADDLIGEIGAALAEPACGAEIVPSGIARLVGKAGELVGRALTGDLPTPKRAQRLLGRAARKLRRATRKAERATGRKLGGECGPALVARLTALAERFDCAPGAFGV